MMPATGTATATLSTPVN